MKKAFTLIEILIVVAILGLVAAIGIPSFLNSRSSAEQNIKDMNVSSVNAAKDQWAIMNNKPTGTALPSTQAGFTNIAPYIGGSITNISQLTVNGVAITLNEVGKSASY